jgi:hypothetical protein
MRRFLAAHPNWFRPRAPATIDGRREPTGYWAPTAWALARTGRPVAARKGIRRMTTVAREDGYAWPFTVRDAGQLLTARHDLDGPALARPGRVVTRSLRWAAGR